jgi:hypothetical protein
MCVRVIKMLLVLNLRWWNGVHIWSLDDNKLNKQQQTSEKRCPPVLWLGQLPITQRTNSLLRYAIITKTRTRTDPLERCKEWQLDTRSGTPFCTGQ